MNEPRELRSSQPRLAASSFLADRRYNGEGRAVTFIAPAGGPILPGLIVQRLERTELILALPEYRRGIYSSVRLLPPTPATVEPLAAQNNSLNLHRAFCSGVPLSRWRVIPISSCSDFLPPLT